jgi:Ca2+-binding RTX toxin-like protein
MVVYVNGPVSGPYVVDPALGPVLFGLNSFVDGSPVAVTIADDPTDLYPPTVTVQGAIYGEFGGIQAFGDHVTVLVTSTGFVAGDVGISNDEDADNFELTVAGMVDADQEGVAVYGSLNRVDVSGAVNGVLSGVSLYDNELSTLTVSGRVTSYGYAVGLIDTDDSTVTVSGDVAGGYTGIAIVGDRNELAVTGTVTGGGGVTVAGNRNAVIVGASGLVAGTEIGIYVTDGPSGRAFNTITIDGVVSGGDSGCGCGEEERLAIAMDNVHPASTLRVYNNGLVNGDIEFGGGNDAYRSTANGVVLGVVYGNDGKDILFGGSSSDTFDGGTGNDVLNGGGGADTLTGDFGEDRLIGGAGRDRLIGGADDDRLVGGADEDLLFGDSGYDILLGGDGNDTVNGGDGNDLLRGDDGNDRLFGDADADTLNGGRGDDQLSGGDGADRLLGGVGSDLLSGGDGDDRLFGGADADRLNGDAGSDFLTGGGGADTFIVDPNAGDVDRILDFFAAEDLLDLSGFGFASVADALSFASDGSQGHAIFAFADEQLLILRDITVAALADAIIV